MLGPKHDHVSGPVCAAKPLLSIGAMAFAQKVAAEFEVLETGYRNGLYNFFGRALTSYRKFLQDPDGYKALLSKDNIARLREQPDLKTTSRLVVYFLTNAKTEVERNTAGKYARIVDYLHQERVDAAVAADHVRSVGGMDAILKKARGRKALKAAVETLQDDGQDFDEGEEPDESRTGASGSDHSTDELFDPDEDLSIRVGSETLERVLGADIDSGHSFYLECSKTAPAGRRGIRIVGRLVDLDSA